MGHPVELHKKEIGMFDMPLTTQFSDEPIVNSHFFHWSFCRLDN